ncbi:MAG TPA: hypothetical protein VL422_03820 [Miltoncostaea sp.]|nr:hypothetical protein [Miltoncostaea sp.]
MTPAARTTHRRPLRRLAILAAVVAVTVAAFGAAIAGSTPDKPYSAFISAPPSQAATTTKATTSVGGGASVGLRLRNDTRTQGLGSANVTLPTGLTITPGSVTLVTPAGGTATVSGQVLQLRNLDLAPGQSAFVRFAAVVPCTAAGANYSLAIKVKQSNDFNGTGNDLNAATPAPVLGGVGSCVPCKGGQQCNANTSTSASLASVSGVATTTGDQIRVSLGAADAPDVDCSGYSESTETVEFDLSNAAGGATGGLKTVKLQIKNPTKATNLYKVCFKAENAAPVVLPVCTYPRGNSSTPTNAPCALAPESRKGVVTLTAITPAGDPWIKG